jgi:hypothetical protein
MNKKALKEKSYIKKIISRKRPIIPIESNLEIIF